MRSIAIVFSLGLFFICSLLSAAEMRSWTGSNGKVIEAEFLGLDGDIVKLKLKNDRESNVLITRFSKEDQAYVKRIGTTDDPFEDVNADDDPDKFVKPENVRFTLELSEKGRAKFRIEKVTDKPKDDFDGKKVSIPNMPGLNLKTRGDGMSRLVFDFKDPIPPNVPLFMFGQQYDAKGKRLLFQPPEKEPGSFDDGGCLFGLPQNSCQLPLKISFDAIVFHRGECCNMEFIFSDCVFFCHVYSGGKEFGDDLEICCRFGTPVGPKNRRYQDVLLMRNVVLNEPLETTFTASPLRDKGSETFRGGIARNLNREDGIDVNRHPLEIKRVSFEGRLNFPPKKSK